MNYQANKVILMYDFNINKLQNSKVTFKVKYFNSMPQMVYYCRINVYTRVYKNNRTTFDLNILIKTRWIDK